MVQYQNDRPVITSFRRLFIKAGHGPWKTWILKNLEPGKMDPEKPGHEKPGPKKTWTLNDLESEKSGP